MEKICPVCGARFECKHEDIAHCRCATVNLSAAARRYLAEHYPDKCLCVRCLEKLAEKL